MVLYKLGYEPPEEEVQVDPQVRVCEERNIFKEGERKG